MNPDSTSKQDKTIDALAKVLVHVMDDKFEKASRIAVNICFALKYALAVAAYIFFRNCIGQDYGELWMALVAAFGLYQHELYINFKLKEHMVAEALAEAKDQSEEDGDDNEKDKDKDLGSQAES